jgi:hypothetical protein
MTPSTRAVSEPSLVEMPKRIRATAPYFYRYQSAEHLDWLKPVILDNEIYMPLVRQLNDPMDGRPKLAPQTAEGLIMFMYNASANPTHSSAAQNRLVQTLAVNVRLHGTESLMRQAARVLYNHVEQYRVFSMSKRCDNMNLWAKYAAVHTGYCLEFANEGPLFSQALDVIYRDSFPMDVNNREHRTGYFFFCKSQQWDNEEEVRLVGLPANSQTVRFDPRWLTRIILGKDIYADHENQIREWAQQRTPPLTVVKAYYDELDQVLRFR